MNRRHFLAAAGATVATAPMVSVAQESSLLDWEKVIELNHFVAVCEQATDGKQPDIRLEVLLERKDPDSRWTTYIKQFDLTWEGQRIPIPERFWNDLDHISLQGYPEAEILKLPKEKRSQLIEELERLKKPKVILSAESGTVLIEWTRGEECDSHSTLRWIITKGGVVLRHRHEPFHLC